MKSRTLAALMLLPLLVLPLVSVLPAYASTWVPVSGTYGSTGSKYNTWYWFAGNNLFYGFTIVGAFKPGSSLQGTFTNVAQLFCHFGQKVTPFDPNTPGMVWPYFCNDIVHFEFTVTGSVLGISGTFRVHLIGTGTMGPTHTEGMWWITNGTGGLTNLRGYGTFTVTQNPGGPFVNSYTGQVAF